MPLITDLIKKEATNKFKKKEYRPWNVSVTNLNEEDFKLDQADSYEVKNITKEIISKKSSLDDPAFPSFDLEKVWRNLYGAKKEVFIYMIKKIEEDDENKVITKNIVLEQLVSELQLPSNTIKGALQQLKKSNLLHTEEKKPGRGGYARYKIPKNIYTFFEAKIKKN